MENLNFKKDAEPIPLTGDFWYMLTNGGYCKPENFLIEEDSNKVRKAIEIIKKYELQGLEQGYFLEI
jgi:hypothetical protein